MKPLRTRLEEARAWSGLPWEVLERDYVLSWILAGIYQVPALPDTLVFNEAAFSTGFNLKEKNNEHWRKRRYRMMIPQYDMIFLNRSVIDRGRLMQRLPALVGCLWLVLCVPLIAYANPEQSAQSDCKSLISHSGFAEFVMPSEGGKQKLAIKVNPSVKWTIQNSDYVDWIEILDGDSGMGLGTMTIQLEANKGKSCRVGTLTIVGPQPIFGSAMRIGSPIRILQQGTETAGAEEQAKSSPLRVINLAPFSSDNPQAPGKPEYKVFIKK